MSQPEIIQASYPVMEHFYTIQGEGLHQGKAAYFIRLGGCDVGCVWCDVKDSWNADMHPKMKVQEMLDAVNTHTQSGIIVITGGEPLMHSLDSLTQAFQDKPYRLHIETSASHPLSGKWDWICVSPKKFKPALPEVVEKADELKVVVFHKSDFEWAEKHAALCSKECKLYLQPEWEKRMSITPLIVDYIKKHPQWQLSLQIHKYIDVP